MDDDMNNDGVSPTKIQKFLGGMDYPAMKDDIVDYADSQSAPDEVLDILKEIPDKEYKTPAALMKEAGKII